MFNREKSLQLLKKYIKEESLIKHCLSVESAMRFYADKFGEDIERWGVVGLLHDFDYEKWPEDHPLKGSEILKEEGYSEDVIEAILSHNSKRTGVERKTKMAKTLYAVDELTGMIMATAYVRPTSLDGMKPRSVKKNLKKKGFAATIDRDEIERGIEELGVEKDEHIDLVIKSMQKISQELGF